MIFLPQKPGSKVTCFFFLFCLALNFGGLGAQQPAAVDTTPPQAVVPSVPPPSSQIDARIGYNLKVVVRLAPVYKEKSLVSLIKTHLPQNSVVAVISEEDNWYHIAYGSEGVTRDDGWVISYGMERTHELEHIVVARDEVDRWAGKKVIVKAGETAVRAFPATQADLLMKIYRDEIYALNGESEDYYLIKLSQAGDGWVWKGDVELYQEPKYSQETVQEMVKNSKTQDSRIVELTALLDELSGRNQSLNADVQDLQAFLAKQLAEEKARAERKTRPPFMERHQIKKRLKAHGGFLNQGFGAKMGLSKSMLKSLGVSFQWKEKLAVDLIWSTGSPTVRQPSTLQDPLPPSLDGLDTLSVGCSLIRTGLRLDVSAPRLPLLSSFKHYLYAGLGILSLKADSGPYNVSSRYLGPVLGWGMSRHLFKRLDFEFSLTDFLARAEVTDVRSSGKSLLQSEKTLLHNIAYSLGVFWDF